MGGIRRRGTYPDWVGGVRIGLGGICWVGGRLESNRKHMGTEYRIQNIQNDRVGPI